MRNIDGPPRRFTDPRRPPDASSAARCSAAPGGGFRGRVRRRAHAVSCAQKQRATAQALVDANGSAAGVAGGLIRPAGRGGGAQPFNRGATLTVPHRVRDQSQTPMGCCASSASGGRSSASAYESACPRRAFISGFHRTPTPAAPSSEAPGSARIRQRSDRRVLDIFFPRAPPRAVRTRTFARVPRGRYPRPRDNARDEILDSARRDARRPDARPDVARSPPPQLPRWTRSAPPRRPRPRIS